MSALPHKELRSYREQIDALDAKLRPFYDRQRNLQLAIARTYPHFERPEDELQSPNDQRVFVKRFGRDASGDRRGLLAELDRLNRLHAPLTNQRRQLNSGRKALEAMIERMTKAEAKREEPTETPQAKQLTLL